MAFNDIKPLDYSSWLGSCLSGTGSTFTLKNLTDAIEKISPGYAYREFCKEYNLDPNKEQVKLLYDSN